jgi:NTE family protein
MKAFTRPDPAELAAGISIGALNTAIAGRRSRAGGRLREFWETICACPMERSAKGWPIPCRSLSTSLAAQRDGSDAGLVPGATRLLQARFRRSGRLFRRCATSFYDTAPLPDAGAACRFRSVELREASAGVVNVRTGNLTYFDTAERRLGPKHFMASAPCR